jgi:hypothetical protein
LVSIEIRKLFPKFQQELFLKNFYQFSFRFRRFSHSDDPESDSGESELFVGGQFHDRAEVMMQKAAANRFGHDDDLRLLVNVVWTDLEIFFNFFSLESNHLGYIQ